MGSKAAHGETGHARAGEERTVVGPTGPLGFGLVMSNLGLGAVVTAPVSPVGIGLEELSSPGGGDPCLLAKPSRKMAAVKGEGGDLGGPLPEDVHGEVTKHLVCGDDPGVGDKVHPCIGYNEYVPECL